MEYTTVSMPYDGTAERAGAIEMFGKLTLPDILFHFAFLGLSPSVELLREQALKSTDSFMDHFGSQYTDAEGKVIKHTEGLASSEKPSEEWIKEQSMKMLDVHRFRMVEGNIEAVRMHVMGRFPIEERHMLPIVLASGFVPPGYEYLYALGLARFWQGDFISAASILVPQLENSLRYALLTAGIESAKIYPDLSQEDRTLSGLLEAMRPEMEDLFGIDLINEIDMLFNYKPGPMFRHDLAHGKLSTGAFYNHTAVYACWLIYQIVCLPLASDWKTLVAPGIEAEVI